MEEMVPAHDADEDAEGSQETGRVARADPGDRTDGARSVDHCTEAEGQATEQSAERDAPVGDADGQQTGQVEQAVETGDGDHGLDDAQCGCSLSLAKQIVQGGDGAGVASLDGEPEQEGAGKAHDDRDSERHSPRL